MKTPLRILCFIFSFLITQLAFAELPVFLIEPFGPTNLQVATNTTAQIQYLVTNLSFKPHVMIMLPIPGVNQDSSPGNCQNPMVFWSFSSCVLNLQINGNQIPNHISEGPVLCPPGTNGLPDKLECYRPSLANNLNILAAPAPNQFTVSSSAGPNGTIDPDSPEVVNSGGSILFSALPEPGYLVDQWRVDGVNRQTGGAFFTLADITANHHVSVSFLNSGGLYAGGQDGGFYYSINGGVNWAAATPPAGGKPITSVFVRPLEFYAGSTDGSVYSSIDNGTNWTASATPAPGFAVNGLYVSTNHLYIASANGRLYICAINGSNCSPTTAPSANNAVNGVFATVDALYVTSSDGYLYYSQDNGNSWAAINGQPDGSPVKSVYATRTTLYISTANEFIYSSDALNGNGSWTPFAQSAFSFYVDSSRDLIFAANQAGYTYSLTYGTTLGFVGYTALNSLFSLA